MSRDIAIYYKEGDKSYDIEIRPPYYLLGTQRTSMAFWALPRLREVGITRLAELGVTDPIDFWGWDDLAELRREIRLLTRAKRASAQVVRSI